MDRDWPSFIQNASQSPPMKRAIILVSLFMIIASGCVTSGGPRSPGQKWQIPQSDASALGDCDSEGNMKYDPLSGYYIADDYDVRQCLIKKHGWFQLGPPSWAVNTMAPPR